MRSKKLMSFVMATSLVASMGLAGCSGSSSSTTKSTTTANATTTAAETTTGTAEETTVADTTVADTTEKSTEETSAEETTAVEETTVEDSTEVVDGDNFIELALNVYYNDSDHDYYTNESGESIIVTGEGQYTLSFDCSKDLSEDAVAKGVEALTNLTAIYIYDMGVGKEAQSPLKSCNIMYDSVVVDGEELTVTLEEPKSAFKSSGIFDTNDPINAWEGSYVAEVDTDTVSHVANFNSVENPTTISVTFTLSDMNWEEEKTEESGETTVSENTYVNTAVFSDMDFTGMTAIELTKYLGNGINLGNTMEAVNQNAGKTASVYTYETAWGQPVTTQEMIVAMKNCGFDTIRIPVAWTNMMDYENGSFTIDTALLDRVEEIVKWALEAEMFVIVNDHWDSGWWELFAGDETEVELAWKIYEAIWTQVSERFADYSDMLIFESANEELGRAWTTKGMVASKAYSLTTKINQKFIDIVRKSGGNNDDRFLLIAGNATDINLTVSNNYVMPEDTVEGKLFISVHYYDPWNYCGDKGNLTVEQLEGFKWGLKEEYEYMATQVSKMDKFIEEGYGVIIGEWGALPAYIGGRVYDIPNSAEYTQFFLDICDVHNYCPVLWSTGTFNKTALTMIADGLTSIFTSRCVAEEAAAGEDYLANVAAEIDDLMANAPDHWEGQEVYEAGTPVAWIMWNGGAGTYSVGDKFNSADNTAGITATNVVVDGAGTYSVSLDFAGENNGLTFAALGLASGEDLYPGCILDIKSITINGEEYNLIADAYTSSDDKHCTRVNLMNQWVGEIPEDARNASGDLSNASPTIVDGGEMNGIKNITVTFELIIPE